MKKMSYLFLSTLMLGAMVIPLSTVDAEDGASYTSNGVITFEPNTDPTAPVDPTDPTKPVGPIDPTTPDGEPEPGTAGPLSIDFASSLDFGKQKITSKTETYTAALQKYATGDLDESGEPIIASGPNYVQVTDNRGTEAGWSLSVKQLGQFKVGTEEDAKELTGAVITLNNGEVVTSSDSAKPTGEGKIILDSKGTDSPVMAAANGRGAGTYLLRWGNEETAGTSITLEVPGSTTKYAEKYATTLSWNLSDIPAN